MTVRASSSRGPSGSNAAGGRVPPRTRCRSTWANPPVSSPCVLLLILLLTAIVARPVEGFPNNDTGLGSVLEGFTQRYRQSVVFVRALRPVGPDPTSRSVLGSPSPGPETETLWSTGIVIDAAGKVLTCADGAQPTDRLSFVTVDGRELPARFLAQDAHTGLALIGLADLSPAEPLTPMVRCSSAAPMRENDWVVILGPDATVGRLEPKLGRLERILPATTTGGATVLRIDVEGVQGGCGALVLDGNGDFVGMVVDCDALTGDSDSSPPPLLDEPVRALPRGFLFETALALSDGQRQPVGFLGVQTTVRSLAEPDIERKLVSTAPVEVRRVLPGSPAEQSGLMAGDLLLSVDGALIQDANQVSDRISRLSPGASVSLRILRDGIPLTVVAIIGDRSSLDWLDRRYRRNLRRERLLESGIESLQGELETLRSLQEHFR